MSAPWILRLTGPTSALLAFKLSHFVVSAQWATLIPWKSGDPLSLDTSAQFVLSLSPLESYPAGLQDSQYHIYDKWRLFLKYSISSTVVSIMPPPRTITVLVVAMTWSFLLLVFFFFPFLSFLKFGCISFLHFLLGFWGFIAVCCGPCLSGTKNKTKQNKALVLLFHSEWGLK